MRTAACLVVCLGIARTALADSSLPTVSDKIQPPALSTVRAVAAACHLPLADAANALWATRRMRTHGLMRLPEEVIERRRSDGSVILSSHDVAMLEGEPRREWYFTSGDLGIRISVDGDHDLPDQRIVEIYEPGSNDTLRCKLDERAHGDAWVLYQTDWFHELTVTRTRFRHDRPISTRSESSVVY